jgi:hypothetical protein
MPVELVLYRAFRGFAEAKVWRNFAMSPNDGDGTTNAAKSE